MSYCKYVVELAENNLHKNYHDTRYGFPLADDNELFGRLLLEINQAGLSWDIILKKEANFRKAYDNFVIAKVARYGEREIFRLSNDAGIIRNHLKIKAAISNAQSILKLQAESGSFANWLKKHHPQSRLEWTKSFKQTFKFTGGEIVNEFLMSTGYLPGAHAIDCPIYQKTIEAKPAWVSK